MAPLPPIQRTGVHLASVPAVRVGDGAHIPCHTPRRNPESTGLAEAFLVSFRQDDVYTCASRRWKTWAGSSRGGSSTTTTRHRTARWRCGRQPSSMRSGSSQTSNDLSKIKWAVQVHGGAQHEDVDRPESRTRRAHSGDTAGSLATDHQPRTNN